jgi:hypothetical protein
VADAADARTLISHKNSYDASMHFRRRIAMETSKAVRDRVMETRQALARSRVAQEQNPGGSVSARRSSRKLSNENE